MGIAYSAAKTNKPEAWMVGKDYYGLTDVFPACAYNDAPLGCDPHKGITIDMLPHMVGSRHWISSTVFRVTDYYKSADEMLSRISELKQKPLGEGMFDQVTLDNLRGFFEWAGDDPIQFISDFDELEAREAEDEYQLCARPRQYRHVNGWNGKAGRKVGY
jgi:hypothetical protein